MTFYTFFIFSLDTFQTGESFDLHALIQFTFYLVCLLLFYRTVSSRHVCDLHVLNSLNL